MPRSLSQQQRYRTTRKRFRGDDLEPPFERGSSSSRVKGQDWNHEQWEKSNERDRKIHTVDAAAPVTKLSSDILTKILSLLPMGKWAFKF